MSNTAKATLLETRGSGNNLKKAFNVLVMAVSHRPRLATSTCESAEINHQVHTIWTDH